jgi:hypothetical protein
MSVADIPPPAPAPSRPASAPSGRAPAKPRPPFRPVPFVLGLVVTLALLVGQFYFEKGLGDLLRSLGLPENWAGLDQPLYQRLVAFLTASGSPEWFQLALRIVVNVVVLVPAAVVFFRFVLRQVPPIYHAPVFITCILAGAHFYYGVLENHYAPWLAALTGDRLSSYSPTFATIAAAIVAELILGRVTYGKWLNPASAYISGISAGILIKSPELWPFVLCVFISIASKYALRLRGRHLWNPTNFGVTVMLLLAPIHTSGLSVQFGNNPWAPIAIWTLGGMILWRFGLLHIPLTFAAVYVPLALLRCWITHNEWLTELAPLTGPMYQLFMCFMITDPKTITKKKWSQCLVAGLVAGAETLFRLTTTVVPEAPTALSVDAAFLALFTVGPTANVIEIFWGARKSAPAAVPRAA